MLRSGDIFNFKGENQKYILLGLDFFNDSDLYDSLKIIEFVRMENPNIKDKDTFLYMIVFFHSVFDFIPYEEFNPEKPIINVIHYGLNSMMTRRVNILKHKDITGYLLKNALVNANVKRYIELDIFEIFKRKKEQLLPYIPDLTQ